MRAFAKMFVVCSAAAVLFAARVPALWAAQQPESAAVAQSSSASARDIADTHAQRLQRLAAMPPAAGRSSSAEDYRIGADDLLDISVFEAPELNRTARVSAGGEISLPLLGRVQAAGLTPQELELVLQELLRRRYMKGPHVSVFVREVQSHAVSVIGAVRNPGVFQIRGAKTLVEVLSMAEGLTDDAGDTVLVLRQGSAGTGSAADAPRAETVDPAAAGSDARGAASGSDAAEETPPGGKTIQIHLKRLLESEDPGHNVPVYPGDVVKVTRAGVVYVIGEVRKPGGFVLRSSEKITVLQALALAEGLTGTASKGSARIIRTEERSGARQEIPIDLSKILGGKSADPLLQPKDILFVPGSMGRAALRHSLEAAALAITGLAVYRR